jgi:hypothetical protein
MYHYTYRLTLNNNTDSRKYYIGARSCTEYPTKDSYFGSCKTLLAWIKEHGTEGIVKEILAIYGKRQDAIEHEINLHNYFDVAKNVEFWNKAKQTSVGFDTAGTKQTAEHIAKVKQATKGLRKTEEHKRKIGLAHKGRIVSEEQKQKQSQTMTGRKKTQEQIEKQRKSMLGKKHSEETKAKISLSNMGKKMSKEAIEKIKLSKVGSIVCFDMEQKKSVKITKEEYHSNKNRYKNNYSKEVRGLENK